MGAVPATAMRGQAPALPVEVGAPARAGRGLYSGRLWGWRARNLFQRGVDRGELGTEFGTQAVHDRDDRKGNAGRNQAILDGRGGILVFQEIFDDLHAGSRPVILSKQTVLDR